MTARARRTTSLSDVSIRWNFSIESRQSQSPANVARHDTIHSRHLGQTVSIAQQSAFCHFCLACADSVTIIRSTSAISLAASIDARCSNKIASERRGTARESEMGMGIMIL